MSRVETRRNRVWLNPLREHHHMSGAMFWEVSYDGPGMGPLVEFHISDCSRKVKLEFPVYTRKQKKESLAKCDKIIKETQKFREALAAVKPIE